MKQKIPKMLTCPFCKSENIIVLSDFLAKLMFKFGKLSFRCNVCGKRWTEKP
ncbi:MAG: hypothetical protein QXO40_03530 [Candidatus Aenigmatarchaeota archaeon]